MLAFRDTIGLRNTMESSLFLTSYHPETYTLQLLLRALGPIVFRNRDGLALRSFCMDASLPPVNDWRLWVYGGYSNPGNTMTARQILDMYGPALTVSAYVEEDREGHIVPMAEERARAIIDLVMGRNPAPPEPDDKDDWAQRPLKTTEELQQEQRERFTQISRAWWNLEQEARRQTMLAQWSAMADKPFVPKNEFGVILLFGTIMNRVGWDLVDIRPNLYPDGVFMVDGKVTLVEFEFASANFITHNHDTRGADMVICWENNRQLDLPVIDLSMYYSEADKSWRTQALRQALYAARTPHAVPFQIVP